MGCSSSKPNPNQFTDPTRPPRRSTRPLHPSAHHPDALPDQHGNYSSRAAARKAVPYPLPNAPSTTTQSQREMAARMRMRQDLANAMATNGEKGGAQWHAGTSRRKGGSKGWMIQDGHLKTMTTKKEKEKPKQKKPDQYLKYAYPPCPGPPPCRPLPAVPAPTKAKPKGKQTAILWSAPHKQRFQFPPGSGPPPNRPLPLLPIGMRQDKGKAKVKYPVSQSSQSVCSAFPPKAGPPPKGPLPKVPVLSAVAKGKWKERPMSVISAVSSLGPEPVRLMPHIARPSGPAIIKRKPVGGKGQWAPLGEIGMSHGRY